MQQVNNKKDFFAHPVGFVLSFLFVLTIFFFHAYSHTRDLDYVAINGTFQNYNVIRRLLSGQIPFKDFTVYLGSGHLLLTSAFTFLFGDNYAASVLAYDFVSSLSIILLCYGFSALRFRRNWLIPAILSLFFLLLANDSDLEMMAKGGNSARIIRALILPICILLYLLISRWLERHINWSKTKQFYMHIALISCIAGVSVVWSNDYGIVCCVAINMLVLLITTIYFKNLKRTLITAGFMIGGVSLMAFFISALITHGHPLIWFKQNFFSAYYQGWYFNLPEEHTFYYYEVDLSKPVLQCLGLCIVYLILLLRNISWENIRRFGLPFFAMLSCFGAAEEYKIFGGGGIVFHDFLIGTLLILTTTEVLYIFRFLIERFKPDLMRSVIIHGGRIIFGTFVVILSVLLTIKDLPSKNFGIEFPELGGYLITCANDLKKSVNYVGNRRIFSTYASALETVTDQFQPSGTDYIIHCMSDEARQHYLDVFHTQDFECVSTVREDYIPYGLWIRNANWFFYREVYAGYHLIGSNSYADYWEPGAAPNSCLTDEINVSIEPASNESVLIVVTAPENVSGIADVYLEYETELPPEKDSFLLHQSIVGIDSALLHEGRISSWTLPPSGATYIPIEVQNGKGKVRLRAYPQKATSIKVISAESNRIFLEEALPLL